MLRTVFKLNLTSCVSKVVEILQQRSPDGMICAGSSDEVKGYRLGNLLICNGVHL
jgi:hypothetical protein